MSRPEPTAAVRALVMHAHAIQSAMCSQPHLLGDGSLCRRKPCPHRAFCRALKAASEATS